MPKLYVGNLAYSATSEDLEALFGRLGKVDSAAVVTDKFSGRSKGFGFVEMADADEADKAIEALNESEFQGRRIKVAQARAGEQRGFGGDRGRSGSGSRGGNRRY